jgi:hypothetical protein
MQTRFRTKRPVGVLLVAAFISLSAGAIAPALAGPIASLSRSRIDYGNFPPDLVGSVQPVFVTNIGDAPLTISGMSIAGANGPDFRVSGTCTPPLILRSNAQCRLDFTGSATNSRTFQLQSGTFSLQSDSSPPTLDVGLSILLDPTGFFLPAAPMPEWIDFPAQPLGTAAPTQTMTIVNPGSTTLTVVSLSLVGGNSSDFTLSSTCAPGHKFGPGASCDATIGFQPGAAGPRSTEVRFVLAALGMQGQQSFSVTGFGGPAGPLPTAKVVEFYNSGLDHYFITWLAQEISDLDNGVHKGWARTGYSFQTYTTAQAGTSPVCRFYIPPALGDSHFFGRGTTECDATGQKNPTFVDEDPAFMHMFLPVGGVCPDDGTEVYRVFSNRLDANHRYMTDKTVRDAMVAEGWLPEGDGPDLVVMCSPL